ncbi:MAG TPA: biopolymer transporter ExbD [Candidatus Hydrogenedentes bacterium]|nr:biopolymer transporter ExbD [Candidatus Hydrogenedentota bacterium]HPG66650.1 biopolymer transporter ExbD [Candidatus Hydrogenedentota bacterium]
MEDIFDTRGRKRKRKPTINITPLIDVMFLLLIFFMVSSTFREHTAIDIALPTAQTASSHPQAPLEIVVRKSGDLYFGTEPVDEQALKRALTEVLQGDADAVLVLRADREADFGRVVRAIDIAREVGGGHLVIPTDPAE